jgi:acetylornithine deacetylase/succinyl-diaminopimelate desuccinylase-like protein
MAELLAAGFPKEDVRVLGPDARTANLVARLRGRNPRARPILLMAHLDVVPARREDWSLDPWTLIERDGWFYGRGTHDNKAGAAMLVANIMRLKRDGWQPERDLIVLLTGDEETTQRSIQWLLAEHRSLIDAELAFNTDGGAIVTREGRPVLFDVQASEKIYADYQLEAADPGGHSSLVRDGNPIYLLSAALSRIGEYQFPLHVTDETRMFLERSAPTESGQTAIDMRAVAAVPPIRLRPRASPARFLQRASHDVRGHSCGSRTREQRAPAIGARSSIAGFSQGCPVQRSRRCSERWLAIG